MLPIKRRVKKESFEKIMKEGVFLHSNNFYLKFLNKKDDSLSSFSFIVPVKVKKTSVGRHLIKRKMAAAVEKFLSTVKPGFSCLVFAKNDISVLSYTEKEKEITLSFIKAKILNQECI